MLRASPGMTVQKLSPGNRRHHFPCHPLATVMRAMGGGEKVRRGRLSSEEQAAILEQFGCNQMQGYLFSKPVPAEAIAALLAGEEHS